MSSLYIVAEALEELVSASDNYYLEYEKLPSYNSVVFEEGLEFSLRMVFPDAPETAENFMLNLMLTIDDAEKKIMFSSTLRESRRSYFLGKLSKIKRAILYPAKISEWESFCEEVCTDELLSDLKFIGETMEDEELVTLMSDHIEEISDEVISLIKSVRESKISQKTKLAVLAQLETISLIMHKYKIFGADRVEGSLKTLLAETLINYKELTEDNSNILNLLHAFVGKNLQRMRSISTNIEAAKTIAALLDSTQK